jgi:hypothetical protein
MVIRTAPNRAPRVYVCVYRQVLPTRQRAWEVVDSAANHNPDLAELVRYRAMRSVYDWDDDPSFFSCQRRFNSDPLSCVIAEVNLTHPGSIDCAARARRA